MQYTVKVKDYTQNTTHTVDQWADSKSEANALVLQWLRANIGPNHYEVV